MLRSLFSFLFALIILSACDQLRPGGVGVQPTGGTEVVRQFLATDAPLAPYGAGKAYEVNGVRYTPQEDFDYVATGTASFYSNALNGALTVSGETYSSGLMTAAHKTLPFQTIVKVTHLQNGRAVIVRINDRGPFVDGRIIDLSEKAARDLAMINDGLARVRVEVLEEETRIFAAALANGRVIPTVNGELEDGEPTRIADAEPSQPTAPTSGEGAVVPVQDQTPVSPTSESGSFYVLVGTYTSRADATAIRDRMASLGNATIEEDAGTFKVYIGPLPSRLEAQAMLGRVFAQGATNASVVQR